VVVIRPPLIPWVGLHDRISSAWLSVSGLANLIESEPICAARCLEQWLTPREHATFDTLVVPKRRREWLAGRVAAKELVRRRHHVAGEEALRRIEIVAPAQGPHKGKPSYEIDGVPGPFDLSISHSGDHAVAALAAVAGIRIGIDLERIEPRARSFEALALSAAERNVIEELAPAARALAVTERWVLKEALSKALGIGLRLALPRVTIEIDDGAGPRFSFDDPDVVRAEAIHARVARFGGSCVATVAIAHGSSP
jgi:phosphopantetheinyl transferase (holo-ACP synthase)